MRTCANKNCGASLDGMRASARYCSAGCRTAGWKDRKGITGYRAVKASLNGRRKPSGMQISYRKAVEALARRLAALGPLGPDDALTAAERVLRPALSDRQRELLEQRERMP